MPVFDVITINEKHIAKVKIARAERDNIIQPIVDLVDSKAFLRWQNYVRKQDKGLTTTSIVRIYEQMY